MAKFVSYVREAHTHARTCVAERFALLACKLSVTYSCRTCALAGARTDSQYVILALLHNFESD